MRRGGFEALAQEAIESGRAVEVTVLFLKLEKPKQFVIGQLMGVQRVRSRANNGSYLQYLIDTDQGTVKVNFGAAFDREMMPILHIGSVYKWTYNGKRDLGGGHSVNIIETTLLDESEAGPLLLNYVNENIIEED